MKDNMKPCHHTLSEDIVFKEVVVVGNGPSGLVTSFMLAGNVPYLKAVPDDLPIDEMLKARLSNLKPGDSLYDTNLTELAEGLEGRSQNPMPILMDILLRPCADLGIQADSLIEWKFDIEKQISHIVVGGGPPGGAWQRFPPSLRALSPPAWLSLPPLAPPPSDTMSARDVALYCQRYVTECRLQRYFRSGVIVNSVSRVPLSTACPARSCPLNARFCVCGYEKATGTVFRYYCNSVVVACGGSDRDNKLHPSPPGELTHLQAVQLAVSSLDAAPRSVLVVGSGVSAADGVVMSQARGLHVWHAHRTPAPALAKLSPDMYPDYCRVHKMMLDGPNGNYLNYKSLADHVIVNVTVDSADVKHVQLVNLQNNEVTEIEVNIIAVLIGSKPDLHFLQNNFNMNYLLDKCKCEKEEAKCFLKNHWSNLKGFIDKGIQSCKARYLNYADLNENCNNNKVDCTNFEGNPYSDGIGFGVDEKKPVDCRWNPLAIDKSSHEMLNAPKGMYALGPVTADSFVRFIPGGALAIVADIHKKRKNVE